MATVSHPCGESHCPVETRLVVDLDRGAPIPEQATPAIPLVQLVPRYCMACPKWDDRKLKVSASRVHLSALRQRGDPAARAFAKHLEDVARARSGGSDVRESLAIAIKGLREAHAALASTKPHDAALRPLFDDRLTSVVKRFISHPEDLFALAGWAPRATDDASWQRYLVAIEERAHEEGGALERAGPEPILEVRGMRLRIGRGSFPAIQPGEVPVVVVGDAAGALGTLRGEAPPILVSLDIVVAGASAPASFPPWLPRAVDPRPSAALVEDFLQALRQGRDPKAPFTEAFITAREHDREWPRAIVREAFRSLSEQGMGSVRDVPGVGHVLILS